MNDAATLPYGRFLDTSVEKYVNKDGYKLEAINNGELAMACAFLTRYITKSRSKMMRVPMAIFTMLADSYHRRTNYYNWAQYVSNQVNEVMAKKPTATSLGYLIYDLTFFQARDKLFQPQVEKIDLELAAYVEEKFGKEQGKRKRKAARKEKEGAQVQK